VSWGEQFANDFKMSFTRQPRFELNLELCSVGEFLDVPPRFVHKHNGMTFGQCSLTSPQTSPRRRVCKIIGKNASGLHDFSMPHVRQRRGLLNVVATSKAKLRWPGTTMI
jgi:hypothetical protein